MLAVDVFYISLATVAVLAIIQLLTYVGTRLMYPPEPRIIYREVPVVMPAKHQEQPVLTQPPQEVQLPEYEPRKPASDSLRMDAELPAGIQETRPPGL